jgi:hypothetical protein
MSCAPLICAAFGCSAGGASDAETRKIIAAGLLRDYNIVRIADGQIEVMSGLAASTEKTDTVARRFTPAYLQTLRQWESAGLLTLREHRQSQFEVMRRFGARTFTVTPDQRVRSAADSTLSSNGYLMVPFNDVAVDQIVSDTTYQSPMLSASEQYRLVLGTYRLVPTEIAKQIYPQSKEGRYRYKALLKFDPISKKFTYEVADYGPVEANVWVTRQIP